MKSETTLLNTFSIKQLTVYSVTVKLLMSLLSLDWLKHTVCRSLRFGYKRYESVKELQFFCGELPSDLIYNLQRWKFLSSNCVVCEISVLYKLQAPVVGDLSRKFGVAKSVCQIKRLVRDFFSMSHN